MKRPCINTVTRRLALVAFLGALTLDPLVKSPMAQDQQLMHTLNNPTPAQGDSFGRSVAISGNHVLVGAPGDDHGELSGVGRAYLFSAATGALIRTFDPPNLLEFASFGSSVAISNSLVLIGSILDGSSVSRPGAAYLFDASTGALLHKLSPRPESGDYSGFGAPVAISGGKALVGAPYWNLGGAYLFDAITGSLLYTFESPHPRAYEFGRSAALTETGVLLGARDGADLFDATTGEFQRGFTPTGESLDFGHSVALSGSLALIGDPQSTPGGDPDVGAAHVFDAGAGILLGALDNPDHGEDSGSGDQFGFSVAVSGDRAIVGALYGGANGSDAGSASLFDLSTRSVLRSFKNPNPSIQSFGYSVAISGDSFVVGAPEDGFASPEGGAAYIFADASVLNPHRIIDVLLGRAEPLTDDDRNLDGAIDIADVLHIASE